jgi:hypothetical protein
MMSKTFRLLVHGHLIAGVVIILLGFGQFFLFLGLDELGVVEVGNALGHGLLLWISVPLGLFVFLLGLLLALLSNREAEPGPQKS